MADDQTDPNALPPLQSQPDSSVIPPTLLGQLQHASQWAGTFGGSDTNLVERYRHNQDITDYTDALARQRAQAQAALIQSDQTAQNYYFASQRLDMQQKEAQMRMQHANEMAPLNLALKQAQIQAEGAAEKRHAAEAITQANDTAGFSQGIADGVSDGTVKPQGPGWSAFLANNIASYPNADPKVIARYGAQLFPGDKLSPEEYVARAVALKQAASSAGLKNTQIHEFQGQPNIVEGKGVDPAARLQHLESLRMKPNVDSDVKTYLDGEIAATKAAIGNTDSAPNPSSPPSFDTPEDFTSAFKAAPAGTVLHYKGKPYKKP